MKRSFDRILARWQKTGHIDDRQLETLERLASRYEDLAVRLFRLRPFLERDAGRSAATTSTGEEPAPPSVDSVMEHIRREVSPVSPDTSAAGSNIAEFPSPRRSRNSARPWQIATAASLLLSLGLLLLFFVRQPEQRRAEGEVVTVRFVLAAPEAGQVTVVGDFNEWDRGFHTMTDTDADGVWEIEIPLQKGRRYTYNFLVDGEEWVVDPEAPDVIEDPFGGEKALLSL